MHINDAIQQFEHHLIFYKAVSDNTRTSYLKDLKQFQKISEEYKVIDIYEIDKKFLINYRASLKLLKNSAITITRKLSTLREFFKFLEHKYDFTKIMLNSPKVEKKLPGFFSRQQINTIFNYLQCDKSRNSQKNKLIFLMLYNLGIRASELINIKLKDIDLQQKIILINGKGSRQRVVIIPTSFLSSIETYINNFRTLLNGNQHSQHLFFSFRNNTTSPYTRHNIWAILKNIGKKCNLKIYPHKLRHSIATHMLESGFKLKIIQQLLGHESINSTLIYTHLDKSYLRREYDKYHPRS